MKLIIILSVQIEARWVLPAISLSLILTSDAMLQNTVWEKQFI